jgi:hypothetical protein
MTEKRLKSVCAIGVLFLVVSLLGGSAVAASESPKHGGVFKMATHQDIPTLDCMMTSADVAYELGGHIFEHRSWQTAGTYRMTT